MSGNLERWPFYSEASDEAGEYGKGLYISETGGRYVVIEQDDGWIADRSTDYPTIHSRLFGPITTAPEPR